MLSVCVGGWGVLSERARVGNCRSGSKDKLSAQGVLLVGPEAQFLTLTLPYFLTFRSKVCLVSAGALHIATELWRRVAQPFCRSG